MRSVYFAPTMTWMRAVLSLIEDDLDAAMHVLERDPPPWLLGTASSRRQCFAADIELAARRGRPRRRSSRSARAPPRTDVPLLHGARGSSYAPALPAPAARSAEAEACAHRALEIAAETAVQIVVDRRARDARIARRRRARRGIGGTPPPAPPRRFAEPQTAIAGVRPTTVPRSRRSGRASTSRGAELSLADATELVRRGRGERRRPDFGWDSLTPTESRVVELVAAGLPNREIAAKLFVSLATVKTHLVHVYGKLDVRTRAELATAATTRVQKAGRSSSRSRNHDRPMTPSTDPDMRHYRIRLLPWVTTPRRTSG